MVISHASGLWQHFLWGRKGGGGKGGGRRNPSQKTAVQRSANLFGLHFYSSMHVFESLELHEPSKSELPKSTTVRHYSSTFKYKGI